MASSANILYTKSNTVRVSLLYAYAASSSSRFGATLHSRCACVAMVMWRTEWRGTRVAVCAITAQSRCTRCAA